ncbi:MAG: ADYC domain-containing protein [Nannocystaceae bacterium]|nr:ADYC domain-containing protein [bacterium]
MMRIRTLFSYVLLALGSIGGCGGPAESPAGMTATARKGTVFYVGGGWGCPTCDFRNSPLVGAYPVPAVAYGSAADPNMPSFTDAVSPSGAVFPVDIDERGLVVVAPGGDIEGHALVGWTVRIKVPGQGVEEVLIYNYAEVPDWTDNGDPVPTFGLSLPHQADGGVNLCPGMDVDETSVVFLDGETYDLSMPGAGAVKSTPDVATLACRGHALAKMKLLGYDPGSPYTQTSAEERAATLRMVTADYCGDGHPHTVLGTAVDWTDYAGHVQYDPSRMGQKVEAEWTEAGASCFNRPRVPGTQPSCSLPLCPDEFGGHDGSSVWTSILP